MSERSPKPSRTDVTASGEAGGAPHAFSVRRQRGAFSFVVLLIIAVFVFDISTPLFAPIAYAIPLFLGVYVYPGRGSYVLASVCTALTVIGFFAPANEPMSSVGLFNRLEATAVFWFVALVGSRWRQAEQERRRLAEKTQSEADAHLGVLAKAAGRLVLSDEPAEMLGPLFEELAKSLGVELYFNYLIGENREVLELESSGGLAPELQEKYKHIQLGALLCGYVAEHGEPLVLEDLQHSDFEGAGPLKATGAQAYAGIPLIAHGRLLGTLAFATSRRTSFQEDELKLMRTISDQVAAVLDRSELLRKLRESERAAQRHLAELRTVYATAPVGLCFLDTELRYLNINKTLAAINGRPVEAHLGKSMRDMVPEIAEVISSAIQRAMQTRQAIANVDLRAAAPAVPSVLRDWLVSYYPVEDSGGALLGMNIVVQDVTALKQAERALKEADRRKDEFLAMLAHELRNPLAPIRTAVKVLDMTDANSPEAARTRQMISRQVAHMARMIDDLLDVSRIARGKVEIRKERCDLARIVHDVVEDHRLSFESAGLYLVEDLPPEPFWIHGDHTRLSQIVGNLLHNASKFTDRGGRVEVRLEREAGSHRAVLRISDTGIGMDAAILEHVFEAFSQADRSLERSRGGLGLGLALVKGLVELHGGAVEAHSEGIGRGSTFIVRLPLSHALPVEAPLPSPTRESPRDAGMRVLVIEDNPDAANVLRDLLELMGYRADVAYAGPTGLEVAREIRPDVVLCDLGLPGMDGFAVAKALRADPATFGTYLIAQTGYGKAEDRRRAREAGFDLHMTKPIDPADLERVLASVASRGAAGARATVH